MRIHGRLLMATGVVHVLLAATPGVFGEQLLAFARRGFFNVSQGLAEFPLLGGAFDYEAFAAVWFFYAGPIMFLYGAALDEVERLQGYVSRRNAGYFIAVSAMGACMVPLSGMTFLLLPQAVYMYRRAVRSTT